MIDPSWKMILVDDDEELGPYIVRMFEYQGLRLTWTPSLTSFIRAAKREKFDVVLLDLVLPNGAAEEVVRMVRNISPASAIVVLSGLLPEEWEFRAIEDGAQEYLYKGEFKWSKLAHAVERSVVRRRSMDILHSPQEKLDSAEAKLEAVAEAISKR